MTIFFSKVKKKKNRNETVLSIFVKTTTGFEQASGEGQSLDVFSKHIWLVSTLKVLEVDDDEPQTCTLITLVMRNFNKML